MCRPSGLETMEERFLAELQRLASVRTAPVARCCFCLGRCARGGLSDVLCARKTYCQGFEKGVIYISCLKFRVRNNSERKEAHDEQADLGERSVKAA